MNPATPTAMPDPVQPAIPAATLVIFRAQPPGPPLLLMVERNKAMVFAAGALVFPGGRVDPGDRALAALLGGDPDDTAARIAAIRETVEEAGLPIGLDVDPTKLEQLRDSLHAGTPFAEALAAAGATMALDRLTLFARWLPRHAGMRNFDTRFYLAELPVDAPLATVDQTENTRLLWATAAQVLADADAGRATIIFPTRRTLERLAQFDTFAAARAQARAIPARAITPWQEERDGRPHLCIPDDLGFPVSSEPLGNARRG